ncbi:hypothetical protein [Ferrimonas futtsuensis]|uniref:hypothetical protein n=1 Tax=Ferrimonas futtsuensis TaxID=364764 RepID=UPI00040B8DEA|nr:hypothetical protein [Ferrimonas futtsuensis]
MRIRCSFTLEPEQHQSHSHAVERLRQWQQREKSLGGDNQAQLARRNAFHRDLYLSGLFLHQCSPQLTAQLSAHLGEPNPEAALQQCLTNAGLPPSGDGALSDGQWQQLTSMLKTAMATPKPEVTTDLRALSRQLEQVEQKLSIIPQSQASPVEPNLPALEAQLAQLVECQQALMEKIDALPGRSQPDFSPSLLQLKQGQEKLMSQLKGLKGQLTQPGTAAAEPEPANLDSRLEKASRVKAKGIW